MRAGLLISSSLLLALRHEVAEAVRVPELRGRPVPGLDVPRAAVLAGPAQHFDVASVDSGHVEVLRWARENGCPWHVQTRDKAAAELGYTDDLGNLAFSW